MGYARVVLMAVWALAAVAVPLEAATATWNRNPESSVTGYRLSYGTQSGVHPTTINVGNVTSYQFFPPAGARYYVVVQAYTATGALSAKSAEVILDLTGTTQNQPPTFSQPPNQSSQQNTAVSLRLTASDPQGSAVTYGATGLPAGLSLNASTGVISGTVTTVGTYAVNATASDGSLTTSRSFSWTVTAASTGGVTTVTLSPLDTTIDNKARTLSTAAQLVAHTYPANRVLKAILMKFDLSQIPANAQIQTATLQLHLVAVDGTDPNYVVSLHRILNKNANPSVATGFVAASGQTWTTATCCGNGAPLAQADISAAQASNNVANTMGAKTWNALSLVQAWRSAPASNFGLLLNADLTKSDHFRAFASMEDATASRRPFLRITYTTSTSGGGTTGDTTAPTVALSSPAAGATVSGSNVTVSASASDAVGVVGVQFRLDGANIGAEDTTAPYSIAWNTSTATNGSHQLTAVARDAAGNRQTSAARSVNVSNVTANRAPLLTQPPNQTSAVGASVSLQLSASDPDGTALVYQASGLPSGLTINASTGRISGTLSATSAGVRTVTATVSDGSLTASRSFTWTVTASTGATTVNLSPLDTTIEFVRQNFSTATRLSTHTYPANRVRKAILMKFDLSQIPANATIQSATLQLHLVGVDAYTTDPNYTISLHRIVNVNPNPSAATGFVATSSRTWTANNCCAHSAPLAQADISSAQAVTTVNRALGAKTWNALSVVQAWRSSPATNYGLLLNADKTRAADRFRDFASMEDGTASRRPVLRITYSMPGTTTTTSAMSATSMTAEESDADVSERLASATDISANTAALLAEPAEGDTPVSGDFDGDGRPDPATFRRATGEWRVLPSAGNFVAAAPIVWGVETDLPVPADYDGDQRTDIAVYRPSTGTWHVLLSSTDMQSSLELQWGEADDRPLAIDHDRDGRADLALPRAGGFDILLSGSNYTKSVTVR